MQKLSFVLLVFFITFTLSAATKLRDSPDDWAALASKSPDYVTKISSSDITKLSPGEYMLQFTDPCPGNPLFDYQNQIYFVYLPMKFNVAANVTLGIIAFISHTNQWGMWSLYRDIFDSRNLVYFVPQNVGNMVEDLQRHTAGSAGIAYFQSVLPINPARIYASGLSGGARIACQMGFDNGTWISGVLGICGCDYHRRVVITTGADPSYGFYDSYPLPNDVLAETLRVVVITGSNDFLETNLNDIYYNGFIEDGLTGWLLDIPGMGHEMADHDTFDQGLALLDDNPPKCAFPCKDCSANRADCRSCYDSLYMSLYVDNSTSLGSCVETCPDMFYSYGGLCLSTCPEGTTATNNGFQRLCVAESTEETSTSSE